MDKIETQGTVTDAIRLDLARMAIEALKFHMDTVLRMFPDELAQLHVDDDLGMALKFLRRVTSWDA